MPNHFRIVPKTLHILVLLSLLFGTAVFPGKALADSTITVSTNADELNTDGDCSLREAIQAANTDTAVDACAAGSGTDTITLPADTYTLTIAGDSEDLNATGDLDIFNSIIINGASQSTTIIQAGATPGSGVDRIFEVIGAGTLANISNVTIANGNVPTHGGGIYININAALEVSNSTFSDNSAVFDFGGGIYNFEGSVTVTDSTFLQNTAICGGGIYNENGNLTITNSTFSENYVPCEGGAIFSSGILSITNSIFSENSAGNDGGGIYNYGGTLDVVNSTFSGNFTTEFDGGGIVNNNGTTTVTNSTFSANSAGDHGGGIFNSGELTVTNSTFSGNSAVGFGGGIFNSNTTLHLQNTILANSPSGGDCYNLAGVLATDINNLIETNGPSEALCGAPVSTSDPMLGELTGSPAYFPLIPGSPAINTGDDTICAAAPVNNTSQNGLTRPIGIHCDIGSFETIATDVLTLKSINTNDGWILESTETSGKGGSLNSTATTFNLGDDLADRQYRAILHFDTSSVPDNAVITSATLKIKKKALSGTNPFSILGELRVDVRKPAFGSAALALTDFKSKANANNVGAFGATPSANWYSATLNNSGYLRINLIGATQFRLRFAIDDNNDNGNDFMKFYSGNAGAVQRPQLVIQYYIP